MDNRDELINRMRIAAINDFTTIRDDMVADRGDADEIEGVNEWIAALRTTRNFGHIFVILCEAGWDLPSATYFLALHTLAGGNPEVLTREGITPGGVLDGSRWDS